MQTMAERLAKPAKSMAPAAGESVDADAPTSMDDRLAGFRQQRRRHNRLMMKLAASALAVTALGAAAWWQLTPNTFSDEAGYGLGVEMSVGQTALAAAPLSASEEGATPTVRFDKVAATTSVNSSEATVTVLECRRSDPRIGVLITLDPSACATLTPLTGRDYTLGRSGVDVIFQVTPHRAGEVHISGLDVAYWDGIRRGRQHITTEEQFTVR